jgi:hypothetical protein
MSENPTTQEPVGYISKRNRDTDTNLLSRYPFVVHPHISRLSLLALALLTSCAAWAQQVPTTAPAQTVESTTVRDPEEYAVLSMVLTTFFTESVKELVIRDRTVPLELEGRRWPNFKRAADAVADLKAKSQAEYTVEARFCEKVRCPLLSKGAEDELFHYPPDNGMDVEAAKRIQDGWRRFHKEHPGASGIVRFSRVGFNSDRTLAVAYADVQASLMSAHGAYFLLVKKNGSWKIESEDSQWFI